MRMNHVMSVVTVRKFVILAAIAALSATSVLTGCSRARIAKPVVEDSTGKKGPSPTGTPTPTPTPTPTETPPPPAEAHLYGENGAQLLADLERARIDMNTALSDMEDIVHLGGVKVLPSTEDLVRSALNVSDVTRLESTLNAYCTVFRGDSSAVSPVDTSIDKESEVRQFCKKAKPIDAENGTCVALQTVTGTFQATNKEVVALRADLLKAPAFATIDALSSAGKLEGAPGIEKLQGEVAYHKSLVGTEAQLIKAAQKLVELAKSINCDL